MKKIYLLASIAMFVFVGSAEASDDFGAPGARSRSSGYDAVQPQRRMQVMQQIPMLEAQGNLGKLMLSAAAAEPVSKAKAGALEQGKLIIPWHQGMPKTLTTGKTAEAIVNTLNQRAAIFGEIEGRVGKAARAPAKAYEVQLRENMAKLKSLQTQYLNEVTQGHAKESNLQNVREGFQAMNDTLDKQYYDLLMAVKK